MKALKKNRENNSNASAFTTKFTRQTTGLVDNRPAMVKQRQIQAAIQQKTRYKILAGTAQRIVDYSGIKEYPLLRSAVTNYAKIEQEDLSKEEFSNLKTSRDRFVPLLGRFAFAHKTKLIIGTGGKSTTGDMAVTQLFCKTKDGTFIEYDENKEKFMQAVEERKIDQFAVKVLFNIQRVKGDELGEGTLKRVGVIQQAFTHEMTIHAENMLDFIEDYWQYDKESTQPVPQSLLTSSQEHTAWKEGKVSRYNYIRERIDKAEGPVRTDFMNRELNDKFTAK